MRKWCLAGMACAAIGLGVGPGARSSALPATLPAQLSSTGQPAPLPATQEVRPARPAVRLIATGGTISNRAGGRLTADELVALVPGLAGDADVRTEQFANASSATLTLHQWLALSRRVNASLAEDPALAGIVITSGTDTLEELAYFLHLTVRDARPVVVTGAMRNPSQVGYEGAANLRAAVRVAAEPHAANRGVLVVLNDEINGARDVAKTDARSLQTFASRTFGALGVVDGERVIFRRTAEGRHTAASEFDVASIETLPRVDVLLVYQGAPGDLIKAAVDLGAKGLVIATAGAGATSGTQSEGIVYAREKQVPVVTTTRTGSGRIASPPRTAVRAVNPAFAHSIAGSDLAPVKARILLMLALTRTTDAAELQRIFDEY